MSKFDEQEKRIAHILADGNIKGDLDVSDENLEKYRQYLKENIEHPCLLTGMEDFPWEERYVFGYGSESEYQKLRKTKPSYQDTFVLLEFEDLETDEIIVKVRRKSDNKVFSIGLDWLEATDKKSNNYQLLDDYACWYVNYQ